MDYPTKNIFVILGMARSGTSAITSGLKALGIDLGTQLTPPNPKWNPKGFWEDKEIVYNINGQVFKTLDFKPYGIKNPAAEDLLSSKLNKVREQATTLLNQRFATTQHWGFKDPSTVKLLPFWQNIFATLQLKENYVVALRNPLSVAQSYHRLTRTEIEVSLLLWLMHLVSAIDSTTGKKRIVVSYELMMENPHAQLARIQTFFNLNTLTNPADIDEYTQQFLDKKLQRHECTTNDLACHPAFSIAPMCLDIYNLVLRLAKDEVSFTDQEFLHSWQILESDLDKFYPIYCFIDGLSKRINQLERQIKTMQKSILWKLLYPLRKIDDILRVRRKKQRESKRLTKAYT